MVPSGPAEITRLLKAWSAGDSTALDRLIPLVYDELRRLDETVARSFGDSVDFDRASIADTQGIGGPRTRPNGRVHARRLSESAPVVSASVDRA